MASLAKVKKHINIKAKINALLENEGPDNIIMYFGKAFHYRLFPGGEFGMLLILLWTICVQTSYARRNKVHISRK